MEYESVITSYSIHYTKLYDIDTQVLIGIIVTEQTRRGLHEIGNIALQALRHAAHFTLVTGHFAAGMSMRHAVAPQHLERRPGDDQAVEPQRAALQVLA